MSALKQLRDLYMEGNRRRFPSLPEYARTCRKYTDKTANGLTRCVIDYIRLSGGQAERINSTGQYRDNSQTFVDVVGRTRTIGTGQWLPTSGEKGTADVSAVIHGLAVKIEIKIGKDRQSADQKAYQARIEAAGGVYLIVRSFAEFKMWFDSL